MKEVLTALTAVLSRPTTILFLVFLAKTVDDTHTNRARKILNLLKRLSSFFVSFTIYITNASHNINTFMHKIEEPKRIKMTFYEFIPSAVKAESPELEKNKMKFIALIDKV